MRDNKLPSNMYKVSFRPCDTYENCRFFPRSHDGLEAAIKLANRKGVNVTLRGEVVWSPEN